MRQRRANAAAPSGGGAKHSVACPAFASSDSCSTSDSEASEVAVPMLCDAPDSIDEQEGQEPDGGEESGRMRSGRSQTGIRGLSRTISGETMFYTATVVVDRFRISSRAVQDLSASIDFLVVLTAVKHCFVRLGGSFETRVRRAIADTLPEHGTSQKELGLRFRCAADLRSSLGFYVSSPMVDDLGTALRAWQILEHLSPGSGSGSRTFAKRLRNVLNIEASWPAFHRSWLEVWSGSSADEVARQLDVMRSNVAVRRERMAMCVEEQEQRRTTAVERRLTRAFKRWQRLDDVRLREVARREAARKREEQRQRDERWRWMRRKDLTMADILGQSRAKGREREEQGDGWVREGAFVWLGNMKTRN